MKRLLTGKLPLDILERMLKRYSLASSKGLLIGPKIGEDCAIIDLNGSCIAISTDPITLASDLIGYYSVIINANDIAVTGIKPRWFTVSILIPERDANEDILESIFSYIHRACNELEIELVGGHTEITAGIESPIVIGNMMGVGKREDIVPTGGAMPGDWIILVKDISIEGTAIIARERPDILRAHKIDEAIIKRATDFIFTPGISIVEEALFVRQIARPHSMHDITEGGIINALYEIALSSKVDILVEIEKIPIYSETLSFCEIFDIDPLGLISSGAFLISATKEDSQKILKELADRSIEARAIGRVLNRGKGILYIKDRDGNKKKIDAFPRDEIIKIY